ncbi:MAG: hypothetical protein AABW92_05875, partial [Nanoarchaeota archaeon]
GIFNRQALGGEIVIDRSNVIAGTRPTIPIETSLSGQIIGHDYSTVVNVFKQYGDDIDGAVAQILKLSRQGNTADNVGMVAYLHGR